MKHLEDVLLMLEGLPLNKELFDCACEGKECNNKYPVSTMWKTMQLRKDVDKNTAGISKVGEKTGRGELSKHFLK